VAGVRVVTVPVKYPVSVEKLKPAGKTPEIEYDAAEKPGDGFKFKVCPGWRKIGLKEYDKIEKGKSGIR
jgi:hypothetical protein